MRMKGKKIRKRGLSVWLAVLLLTVSSLPVYAQGEQSEKSGVSVDAPDESAGEKSSEINEDETDKNKSDGNTTESSEANDTSEENGEISGAPEDSVTDDSATGNSEQGDKGETPADEVKVTPSIGYRTHVQDYGWQDWKKDGATAGTTGEAKRLEAIQIQIENASDLAYEGGVEYRTHVQDYGWESNWASNGGMSGTSGQAKRLEAIQVRLTGELAEHYDIYYRVHAEDYGWLGWARNGATAGTTGLSYRIEALEIRLVPKNEGGPSGGGSAYRSTLVVPAQNGSGLSSFGSYSMTIGTMTKLNNAINNFTRNGHRVGFYMLDLYSGNGIYYNSNESFYGASTVKGPYVVSLNEKVPNSPNETGSTMRSCIKVSDNNAYVSLRNRYGNAPFASFASEAGCTGLNTNREYIDFTARQLAQLWVKNYQFFYSGKANSTFCRDLFTGTLNSPISNTLGKTYTVYSKAGWIGEGGHNNVQNDAGVVMRNGHPYVIVMLSSAYGQLGWLNTLTSAINDAHEELIANSN